MTLDGLLELLREACESAGSQSKWAQTHGLSQAYVSDVMQGRRRPGDKLLAALGVEKVVTYRKKIGPVL